jgi:hypothetical protein
MLEKLFQNIELIVEDILQDYLFRENGKIKTDISRMCLLNSKKEKEMVNLGSDQDGFIKMTLPGIVALVNHVIEDKGYSIHDTAKLFRTIEVYGRLFAETLCNEYNPHPQIPERITNKFQLYDALMHHPDNLKFLLDSPDVFHNLVNIAEELSHKYRYIARLFLISLAEKDDLMRVFAYVKRRFEEGICIRSFAE